MIIEFLLNIFKALVLGIIDLLPVISFTTPNLDWLETPLRYLYLFVPKTAVVALLGVITFWISIHLLWKPVLFIYRRIRG